MKGHAGMVAHVQMTHVIALPTIGRFKRGFRNGRR